MPSQPQARVLGCELGAGHSPCGWLSGFFPFIFRQDPWHFHGLPNACAALITFLQLGRCLDTGFISQLPSGHALYGGEAHTNSACLHMPRV